MGINRRKALRGGAIVILFDNSATTQGSAEGTSPATANVTFNKANGTYSIGAGFEPLKAGTQHTSSCARETCRELDTPFYVTSCLPPGMGGTLSDPNQLHGSTNEVKTNIGRSGKGTATWTVTWDLGRQGNAKNFHASIVSVVSASFRPLRLEQTCSLIDSDDG